MAIDRFTLEFPTLKREKDALEYIREFNEEEVHPCGTNKLYTVLQSAGQFKTYKEWLSCCRDSRTAERSINGVPTETYFMVRESDNRIVGMTSIRLELNERYWNNGGNIGYSIRRSERGKRSAPDGSGGLEGNGRLRNGRRDQTLGPSDSRMQRWKKLA